MPLIPRRLICSKILIQPELSWLLLSSPLYNSSLLSSSASQPKISPPSAHSNMPTTSVSSNTRRTKSRQSFPAWATNAILISYFRKEQWLAWTRIYSSNESLQCQVKFFGSKRENLTQFLMSMPREMSIRYCPIKSLYFQIYMHSPYTKSNN